MAFVMPENQEYIAFSKCIGRAHYKNNQKIVAKKAIPYGILLTLEDGSEAPEFGCFARVMKEEIK